MMMERDNIQFVSPGLFFDVCNLRLLEEPHLVKNRIVVRTLDKDTESSALDVKGDDGKKQKNKYQQKVTTLPMPSNASSSDEDVQITAIEFANILSPLKKNVSHRIPRLHAGNLKRFRQSDSGLENDQSPSLSRPLPFKFKRSFTVKNREMKCYFRLLGNQIYIASISLVKLESEYARACTSTFQVI